MTQTRQRRGLPRSAQVLDGQGHPLALRAIDGGRALATRPAPATPARQVPAPDPWAAFARARLARQLVLAREAELEAARQALADRDRDIRILRCELEAQQADHECTVEDLERQIAEAERRGRHEAMRTARHGGRLPSILAVRS